MLVEGVGSQCYNISRNQNEFLDPRCQRGISEVAQEKTKEINMIMITKVIFACVKKFIL